MAVVYCHKCGHGNSEGRGACLLCYAPLGEVGEGAVCLACNAQNPGSAVFCSACGVRIGETGPPAEVVIPTAAAAAT
ncbi:MAG: zinc ribbon domain-containing protein, partial [Armatimonadota bacterium]